METVDYYCYRLDGWTLWTYYDANSSFQVLSVVYEKVNNPSADDPFEPEIAAVSDKGK